MAVYVNPKIAGVGFAGSGREIVTDLTLSQGIASATEQIIKQYTFPAGTLTSVSWFKVNVLWAKTGAVDATTVRFRFGPLGTVVDPSLTSTSIAAGSRTNQTSTSYLVSSATELRLIGASSLLGFEGGPSSATTYPSNSAVSSMATNTMILSLTMTPAGATDIPQVPHVIITVY